MAEPEPTPVEPEPLAQRRRLGPAPGDEPKGNRTGCLAWGAALGVIFGIMFALYGLKPILRAIYGEDTVASGAVFEGDGLTLAWVGLDAGPAGVFPSQNDVPPEGTSVVVAYLEVGPDEDGWDPAPADVRLEIDSQHEWIVSRPQNPDERPLPAGQQYRMEFVFWVPPESQPFEVEALHIAEPRLKMLPPVIPPPDMTPAGG